MASHHTVTLTARLCLLTAMALGPTVQAAGRKAAPPPPVAASETDRLACQQGPSGTDLDACMKELRAVRAARLHGELATPTDFVANRSRRCDALRGDDHSDCLARMRGEGTVSGSVEGGGLLRELVTEVPAR